MSGDGMGRYRAVTAASKPPVLPLSTQMRVAAEMATPEIRGLAEMIGTEWQAEALRLEGAVEALRIARGYVDAWVDEYARGEDDLAKIDAILHADGEIA
jgi:hypothetical protein